MSRTKGSLNKHKKKNQLKKRKNEADHPNNTKNNINNKNK